MPLFLPTEIFSPWNILIWWDSRQAGAALTLNLQQPGFVDAWRGRVFFFCWAWRSPAEAAVAAAWCQPRGPVSCSLCQKMEAASSWPILWVRYNQYKVNSRISLGKGLFGLLDFFFFCLLVWWSFHSTDNNWGNRSTKHVSPWNQQINLWYQSGNNMYHLAPCCLLSLTPDESISFKSFPYKM